ncbi:MAG: DUF2288 family protein [Bdellovibrionales bacterium]|nr:DUF2288 family protein [Bdellovibrionales bacterium]
MSDEVREKIKSEILEVEWEPLAEHHQREAVVVVSESLNLIDVAEAVIQDDVDQLKGWLKSVMVYKPAPDQVTQWSATHQKFLCVIVQPYVLVQIIPNLVTSSVH